MEFTITIELDTGDRFEKEVGSRDRALQVFEDTTLTKQVQCVVVHERIDYVGRRVIETKWRYE